MLVAVIREAECVGCAKCLPACPVDAILGAPRFLHTVLTDECIGCGLCIAPCPMDCIDLVKTSIAPGSVEKQQRAETAKMRYQARQKRLILQEAPKLMPPKDPNERSKIQNEIKEAVKRVNQKRSKRDA